jgi:hypothetical protein
MSPPSAIVTESYRPISRLGFFVLRASALDAVPCLTLTSPAVRRADGSTERRTVTRESIKVLGRLVDTYKCGQDRQRCTSVMRNFKKWYERIKAGGSAETGEKAIIDFQMKVPRACGAAFEIVKIRFV